MPQLEQWANFYVIMGSSAGALTGLMFVVIVLTRDFQSASGGSGTSHARRSFATPTIVHFTAVLSLAGVLSMPGVTRAAMGLILLGAGLGLLVYVYFVARRGRRLEVYQPDMEDHAFHFILPSLAYASVVVAGASAWASPSTSLYFVAASMIGLLIIGIHNAWDSAVWMVMRSES